MWEFKSIKLNKSINKLKKSNFYPVSFMQMISVLNLMVKLRVTLFYDCYILQYVVHGSTNVSYIYTRTKHRSTTHL